ncbi:predicted protein [Histoplasma capsulatum H143]|uniref:Uncharacterized protein n=1 Tax=Ajellomyces capsulatus (strain H143) TaxID=544712 RepID=C6HED6_AJECH|nr:predicted protein [Histoplasma capsulatum H143]
MPETNCYTFQTRSQGCCEEQQPWHTFFWPEYLFTKFGTPKRALGRGKWFSSTNPRGLAPEVVEFEHKLGVTAKPLLEIRYLQTVWFDTVLRGRSRPSTAARAPAGIRKKQNVSAAIQTSTHARSN